MQRSRFLTEWTTQDICQELAARAMKKMADEEDSREEKRNREEEEYAKLMAQKREMRKIPPLVLNTRRDSISTQRVQFHGGGGGGVRTKGEIVGLRKPSIAWQVRMKGLRTVLRKLRKKGKLFSERRQKWSGRGKR